MKKEDIYVKLTKNNIDKVISILKDAGCEYDFLRSRERLNSDVFKELYLSLEYKPKTLEVGKWYKYQGFDHKGNDKQILFLFNGIKGIEGKMIGFDNNGEYCDNISIYYASAEIFQEAKPEEVIEAFIYHMENFADKRRNITASEMLDILSQFHKGEISFSKVVELVNKGGK